MVGAIEVGDLHKSYGSFEAFRGISFSVAAGESVAVLGPNGTGKTTTVEILEGYRPPTSGAVRVLGLDPMTSGPELRRRIGIVLQEAGFPPELTVRELIDTSMAPCYAVLAGWFVVLTAIAVRRFRWEPRAA